MNKLKTIDDINNSYFGDDYLGYVKKTKKLIKQEAIKWIKHCREINYKLDKDDWIEFFNLTEEDLK